MEMTLFILGVTCCAAMTLLTADAWRRLRRQQQELKDIRKVLSKTLCVVTGEQICADFDRIKEMEKILRELLENDQYEEAERLKAIIDDRRQAVDNMVRAFRKEFGEDMMKIEIIKTPKPDDES